MKFSNFYLNILCHDDYVDHSHADQILPAKETDQSEISSYSSALEAKQDWAYKLRP